MSTISIEEWKKLQKQSKIGGGARQGNASPSGGRRPDLDNRYFRSRWEANYARYLNWLVSQEKIHRWEYEVDEFEFPIKRGQRFYIPDFKVWLTETTFEYHEVKGWMDPKSKAKMNRMAKYHPTVKVLVIGKKEYNAVRRWSGIIPNWESERKR